MHEVVFSADVEIPDFQAQLITPIVRKQINGLRLQPEAVGTFFEVRHPSLPGSLLLKLDSISKDGIVVDESTRIGFRSPVTAVRDLDGHVQMTSGRHELLLAKLRGEIGPYISTVSVHTPDNLGEYRRAQDRVAALVGLPTDQVIADLTMRLKGREWLDNWSMRHYGLVLNGNSDVQRGIPFVLFTGDPGTGKSVVASHISPIISKNLNMPLLFVQLNARLRGTGIQGRAGTEVVSVFEAIAESAAEYAIPTVVFLDEAESVAGGRAGTDESSGAQENVAVVDAMIVALDRVFARSDVRLILLAATNLVARIDPAILRRATVYKFERPSRRDRRAILEHALGRSLDAATLDSVNEALERPGQSVSAADVLNQVVSRAIRGAASSDRPITAAEVLVLAAGTVATASVPDRMPSTGKEV